MITRPPRIPPFLPIYPESQWPELERRHADDVREWQREAVFAMWTNAAMVMIPVVGIVCAALMGPHIIVDAMTILAR